MRTGDGGDRLSLIAVDIHPPMCLTAHEAFMKVLAAVCEAATSTAVPVPTAKATVVSLIGECGYLTPLFLWDLGSFAMTPFA